MYMALVDIMYSITSALINSLVLPFVFMRRVRRNEKRNDIFNKGKQELCRKLQRHENHPKVQACDIGRLGNQIGLRDHSSAMTTPKPISKSAAQRANRQTADRQTDRGGGEDKAGWRAGEMER